MFKNKISNVQIGLLLAIIGTALFSIKSIFIKFAYAEGVDTETLLALRLFISAPFYLIVLLWILRKKEAPKPQSKQLFAMFGLGFLGYYLSSYLDLEGLNYISAQLERLTLYTYPIITVLLSWLFLKEIITFKIIFSLILTYTGIIFLYAYEKSVVGNNVELGVILVMGAAFSFSCYAILSKSFINQFGSQLFTSIAMLASTVFISIHFLATHDLENLLVTSTAWIYVFVLAIFSTVLPSFLLSEAIARIGASKTTIVGMIGPIFTIILAVFFLHEPFGWTHFLGVLLVISGVGLLGKK